MTNDPSDTLRFLPVGVDVRNKDCLVVGGGSVGTRKAFTLTHAGAVVTVVSPAVTDELAELIGAGRVRWVQDSFREEHVSGAFLAVAATDDDDRNAAVVQIAVRSGALACDASSAERSQVIFGALLEGEDVTIAVFTGGRDPALARRTRDEIADLIGQDRKLKPQP
ncbi:MAG: bifunctional precorrin-2 dehydrogenase/sirohydrochlorin ferrochelatase [Gemmatimonadota bacterium]|nr:MAG: bifunctional precorrin-2 dehydrogenase/sirohydrochlorin ferrochelatase [Gemmatimonadota bacterium]